MKFLTIFLILFQVTVHADEDYYAEKRKREYEYRVQQFRYQQILNRRPVHETYLRELEMESQFKRRGELPEEYPQYNYGR